MTDKEKEAIEVGRKIVDEALKKHGYDSMIFAEARHVWLQMKAVLETD